MLDRQLIHLLTIQIQEFNMQHYIQRLGTTIISYQILLVEHNEEIILKQLIGLLCTYDVNPGSSRNMELTPLTPI